MDDTGQADHVDLKKVNKTPRYARATPSDRGRLPAEYIEYPG
ncbi:hypothetical protein [Limimaricola litoreus]|nr:hypothetical protein [Limimaricola litoreus]